MRNPKRIELLEAEAGDYYEPKVTTQHHRIDLMRSELHHQISMLTAVDSFVAARCHLKLYIVTWCSLSDVTAALINEVYELGIDEKDVNLTMILRCARVKKTKVGAVFQRHKKAVDFDKYSEKRNDIVHRGILNEEVLKEIFGRANSNAVREAMGHSIPSDWAYRSELELKEFLRHKRTELDGHMDATESMLLELLVELAKHVAERIPSK